jgi:hypothetical protein
MSIADIAIKLTCHEDTVARLLSDTGLGGRLAPEIETVKIYRRYWSGLSAVLRGSLPRGVPPHWPLAISACTLIDIVDHIDRDLLHVSALQCADDGKGSGAPANGSPA